MSRPKLIVFTIGAFVLGVGANELFRSNDDGTPQAGAESRAEIIFYSEPDFQGEEVHIFEDAVDLPFEERANGEKVLWNDNVKSLVVVSGTWRLYQHGRMNTEIDDTPRESLDLSTKACAEGWSTILSASSRGPLRIASPELAGIGSDISSVQLESTENLPDWVFAHR